jgi:hypothetical protein
MSDKQNFEEFLLPERPDREEVTLPSGLECVLRPPSFDLCIMYGKLPGSVLAAAKSEAAPERTLEIREDLVRFAHSIIEYVFIEPRFSQTPGPGEYHPNRLQPQDRLWIESWADKWIFGGGSAELRKFRGAQPGSTGDAGASGEVLGEGAK